MSTQPTDAELFALIKEHFGLDQRRDDTVINRSTGRFHDAQRYRDFAAAVLALAKWGQPAQETKGRKVFVCTHCDGVYADQPVTQCDCLPDENTFTEGWICFGAPAQAADPLTYEQILALWSGEDQRGLRPVLGSKKVLAFARAIEATHGIKGGQHEST